MSDMTPLEEASKVIDALRAIFGDDLIVADTDFGFTLAVQLKGALSAFYVLQCYRGMYKGYRLIPLDNVSELAKSLKEQRDKDLANVARKPAFRI